MEEGQLTIIEKEKKGKGTLKWILISVGCVAVIGLIVGLFYYFSTSQGDYKLEQTQNAITRILPRNEMYVATAIIEDYTTEKHEESFFGLFPETHTCAQMLRQKVSYKIDLSKLEYELTDEHHIIVKMPQPEYTASTQASPFISDDENYWKDEMPSTDKMKAKVEKKIRERFDTKENRQKASLYAQEAILHMLNMLDFEVEFVNDLEKTDAEG